jgi:hypothetical protein
MSQRTQQYKAWGRLDVHIGVFYPLSNCSQNILFGLTLISQSALVTGDRGACSE